MSSSTVATYNSPHLTKAKSTTNLLDRIKLEQSKLEEQLAIDYLNKTLDLSISSGKLQQELKDGVILCNLVNHIRPGTIKMVAQKKDFSFIQMDNITRFLQGVRQLGMGDHPLFEATDLHGAKDMSAVIHTILTLAEFSAKLNPSSATTPLNKEEENQVVVKDEQVEGGETSSSLSKIKEQEEEEEEGENKSPQYRHIKDIFSQSPPVPTTSTTTDNKKTLRVNTKEANDPATTSNRPPKSPLRPPSARGASIRLKQRKDRSNSVSSIASTCSTSSTASNIVPLTPPTPATPNPTHRKRQHHENSKSVILDGNIITAGPPPQRKSLSTTTDRHSLATVTDEASTGAVVAPGTAAGKIILEDEEGNTITTYQLGNCIGKGQFGSVYRALDLSTGEVVAVKRVKLEDEDLYKEIIKEVNILKTLSHTNVVKYIGFIPTQQYLNIVLEYAENGSLMSTLKAFGAFPEKLVASFCIKILRGLEYLHENQVVHCDLKAANILTTKTGDVKLTDFGVSLNLKIKAVDADSISGTPNWMAPEVIELKGATTKSDIWSLGCTLVELVTGKPPYGDLLAMSAMFRIVEDEYPPLPETISQEMKDFLLCCFQKDPDQRSSSKELQQHEWIKKNERKATSSSTRRMSKDILSSHDSTLLEEVGEISYKSNKKKNSSSAAATIGSSSAANNKTGKYYSLNANTLHHSPSFNDDANSHQFIETSFGKTVECKVCNEVMTKGSYFCEVCSLVCHKECKKIAFSCPPKVNDQQPSYDWVFSAKIYNRNNNRNTTTAISSATRGQIPQEFNCGTTSNGVKSSKDKEEEQDATSYLRNHPQAESIRKYSRALGLSPQEQLALCKNEALLNLAIEKTAAMNNEAISNNSNNNNTMLHKLKKKASNRKMHTSNMTTVNGQDEQCIIS